MRSSLTTEKVVFSPWSDGAGNCIQFSYWRKAD
jgi:hypothetical protein